MTVYTVQYLTRQDKRKEITIKADSAKEAERQFRCTHPQSDRVQKISVRE
jgi:hypothetical protein